MSKFTDWLLGRNRKLGLPHPFDEDLEDAYLDGPSALSAEVPVKWTKETYEKSKKRYNPDLYPPARETPSPFEDDPTQAQSWKPDKKGKPFDQWEDGKDYKQTAGYVIYDYTAEYGPHPFNVVGEDKSSKHTFHYCQQGHVHQYINDELTRLTRYTKQVSKHFPSEKYYTSDVSDLYYRPLTQEIRNVPDCD